MMKRVHFIGIGGIGLSAIARILIESGYKVSGSDRTPSSLTTELEQVGLVFFAGHHADNVLGSDIVIRSSAIPDDNPEVLAARALNIPVLKRMDFLRQILDGKTVIAVAGTHGKTTTTAMISWVLCQCGQNPSYIIGGISKNLETNAHSGTGNIFVIEADEYDRMFLGLQPDWAVLTNVEHDHPDCYPTLESYQDAYINFINQIKPQGGLLVCQDDAAAIDLANQNSEGKYIFSYGLTRSANYFADAITPNQNGGYSYKLFFQGGEKPEMLTNVDLQVPGKHNIQNSVAAMGIIHRLGLPLDIASQAISEFTGTGRRFDILGVAAGVTIIDDYAHHPTEILTTLAAARSRYQNNRIWAVWQPHTYSRIISLLDRFTTAFSDADRVIVTEIFAAREMSRGFSAIEVAKKITKPPAHFIPELPDVVDFLSKNLLPGDILIVLSAGDANQVSKSVYQNLLNSQLNRVSVAGIL